MKLERKHGVVTGSGKYEVGSKIVLTVTPDEGYEFVQWEDGNTDNPRTIVAEKDVKFVAMYSKIEIPEVQEPVVEEEVAEQEIVIEEPVVETEAPVEEVEVEAKPKKTTPKKKKSE